MSKRGLWFVLTHRSGPSWRPGTPFTEQRGIEAHVAFMRSLEERGVLVLGGPFADPTRDGPVGMAIIRADGGAMARKIAEEDGSLQSGLLRVDVREWLPKMGAALDA
ncbi:MAG TPA: YciI family protein [Candidatus Limnocylindria bacterium]